MKSIEYHLSNLEFVRQVVECYGLSDALVGLIEEAGEIPWIHVTGPEPASPIRERIEAGNIEDSADGRFYAVASRHIGQPMDTILVAAGRLLPQDVYGASCSPTQLSDGPVRLYYTWYGAVVQYEVSLGQLGDLVAEIAMRARE